MVGFIFQDEEQAQQTNLSSNLKAPLHSTFPDFLHQFVPEIQDFPLPVNASLLDFDSITDWIEEMQDPDANNCSDNPCLEADVQLHNLEETPTNEGNQSSPNCITAQENFLTPEIKEELIMVDGSGECLEKERIGSFNSGVEENAEKLLSVDCVVEEGLGKVTMVDEVEFNPVDHSSRKDNAIASEVVEAESDESSASESESGSSSDSSSSSSSSSSEDEDDAVAEGRKDDAVMDIVCEAKDELEEGEIMETNARKGNFSKGGASEDILIGDDDEDVVVGPIMSKNELKVLPAVPPVDVTLQPSHQMLPVGTVNSMLGAQVIVEGGEKHNPLSEGSILWITEKKSPLGRVDEIFGPVKNPYYIVRYNSESEVPEGIQEGCLVSFVPEFVDHVLNNKNLYQKGYDASGNDDEEVDEAEFSDDEQEAEYRRMIKMSKRGNKTDGGPVDHKRSNKSLIRNDARSNNSSLGPVQSYKMQNQQFQSPTGAPPNFNLQYGFSNGFPQQGQTSGLRPSGVQPSGGMQQPFQQMPFIQQPPNAQGYPMRPPFQQPFNPNNNIPAWNMVPNQVPIQMALQAQLAQLSMLSGMLLAGQQGGPPQNAPQFNQGGPPSLPQNAPQFNQAGPSSLPQNTPQFNQAGPSSLPQNAPQFNQACPPSLPQNAPQFNQGGAPSLPQNTPQFNQGGPQSLPQNAPQFNQGATTPFQARARGGRFQGRGGRRGGGRSFHSR